MQGDKYRSITILLHAHFHLDQDDLLTMFSSFLFHFSGLFIRNHLLIGMWICVWVFNVILMISLSVYMIVPCGFFITMALQLEISDSDSLGSFFIVQMMGGETGI